MRKIQLRWAREFLNLGKICGEILKTRRGRSKRYFEVMIDVGSRLLNRPSLKPLKRDAFDLGLARFGARVGAASAIARDADFLLLNKGFWTLPIALLLISAWSIGPMD